LGGGNPGKKTAGVLRKRPQQRREKKGGVKKKKNGEKKKRMCGRELWKSSTGVEACGEEKERDDLKGGVGNKKKKKN